MLMNLRSLLVVAVLITGITALKAQDMLESDSMSIALSGERLSDAERDALEVLVKTRPDDSNARFRLVGYYFGKQAPARVQHVLWVIKNVPASDLAGSPFCTFFKSTDSDAYAEGARLWQEHTAPATVAPEILLHAAAYLGYSDTGAADDLLRRGMKAFPQEVRFPETLAQALSRRRPARPAEAYALFEQALLLTADEEHRFYMLDNVTKAAVDARELAKAKAFATELLLLARRIDNWNTGNAVHHGNLALGRIALLENDVELACAHLLKAGATKGSPQLDSFGPNMVLAKELLDHGHPAPVLAYFDLCANFWKDSRLTEWKRQVQAGGTPDFGANLLY